MSWVVYIIYVVGVVLTFGYSTLILVRLIDPQVIPKLVKFVVYDDPQFSSHISLSDTAIVCKSLNKTL